MKRRVWTEEQRKHLSDVQKQNWVRRKANAHRKKAIRPRTGCDVCKLDKLTYYFKHISTTALLVLWICPECYAAMTAKPGR